MKSYSFFLLLNDYLFIYFQAKTNQYERRFWVGASDLAVEGDWKWLDGTLVNRAYFHPQEPNNAYNGLFDF